MKTLLITAFLGAGLLFGWHAQAATYPSYDGKTPVKVADCILVTTRAEADSTHVYTLNPDNTTKPFLGIGQIRNEILVKEKYQVGTWNGFYLVVGWLVGFLRWLFLLSFGIGLFNLLPLPLVDGGRMAQTFLHKLKGPEAGEKRYRLIGFFFLLVLILNLIYPLIGKLFSS